jgi:hypothetical protein
MAHEGYLTLLQKVRGEAGSPCRGTEDLCYLLKGNNGG